MLKLGGKVSIRRREMSCNVGHKCKRNNARIPGPQFNLMFALGTFVRHRHAAKRASARNVRHAHMVAQRSGGPQMKKDAPIQVAGV